MKTKIQQYLSLFFRIISILFLGILLLLLYLFFKTGYHSFLSLISDFFNFGNKIKDLKEGYLTQKRFYFIRDSLVIFIILYAGLTYFIIKYSEKLSKNIIHFFVSLYTLLSLIFSEVQKLSAGKKIIFSLLAGTILLTWIYGMFHYPLTNDEVFSYLYLVDNGFIITSVYYPGPNNHIFYLQLCNIVDLFLDDPLVVMRIPAISASLFILLLVFIYLLKRFSYLFALLVIVVFFSFYNIYYFAFHGRGYVLIYLFFILALIALIEWINSDRKKLFGSLYVVSCVLGFYSIPIFLYPFVSLHMVFFLHVIRNKNRKNIRAFLISSLLIALLTGLLYLPVILVSGLQSITGNSWVVPMSFEEFWRGYGSYLKNTCDYLFDLEFGSWIGLLLVVSGLFTFNYKIRGWYPLFISCLFVPFIILLIQRVHPFFRVWDYMLFIFSIFTGAIFLFFINKIKSPDWRMVSSVVVVALILASGFWHYKMNTRQKFSYYVALNQFMDHIYQKEFYTAYAPDDTYSLFLLYNGKLRHKNISLVSDPLKLPDIMIIPASVDTSLKINKELYYRYLCNRQMCGYIKKGNK